MKKTLALAIAAIMMTGAAFAQRTTGTGKTGSAMKGMKGMGQKKAGSKNTVQVKGYRRKDGTWVKGYTRSKPGTKKGGAMMGKPGKKPPMMGKGGKKGGTR